MINVKSYLENLNINKNSNVCITSNILSLIKIDRDKSIIELGNLLLGELLDYFGESGTIVIPSFNWDFCNKNKYNILKSPSQVGSLGNIALKNKYFRRTNHPIYSFLTHGKLSNKILENKSKDAFSKNSLIHFLYENNFIQIFIDTKIQDGFYFVHLAEQNIGVDYRFIKNFKGIYTDNLSQDTELEYSMYVRKDASLRWNIKYTGKKVNTAICESFKTKLIDINAYNSYIMNSIEFQSVEIFKAVNLMEKSIKNNSCLVFPRIK